MTTIGLSRRALAKRLGVTEGAIRRRLADGTLAPALLADNTLDPTVAKRLLARRSTRSGSAPAALVDARRAKLLAQVRDLDDAVAELRAGLLPLADARAAYVELGSFVAATLLALPAAVAPLVVGKAPDAIEATFRDRLYEAMHEIADSGEDDGDDDAEAPRPRLGRLSEAMLAARKAELQAERLDLQRRHRRGEMVRVDDWGRWADDAQLRGRAQAIALPSRLALPLATAGVAEAREIITAELHSVVAELALPELGVTAADLAPPAPRRRARKGKST